MGWGYLQTTCKIISAYYIKFQLHISTCSVRIFFESICSHFQLHSSHIPSIPTHPREVEFCKVRLFWISGVVQQLTTPKIIFGERGIDSGFFAQKPMLIRCSKKLLVQQVIYGKSQGLFVRGNLDFELLNGKLILPVQAIIISGVVQQLTTPKIIYGVGRGRFRFLCPKIDGLNHRWFSS